MIVKRDKWFLIVGSDHHNSCFGLTFGFGPIPPNGIGDAWLSVWRVNIRWPITVRVRHPFWHRHGLNGVPHTRSSQETVDE